MLKSILVWLGFARDPGSMASTGRGHEDNSHGHTHGVVDPTIATTARGIWAIKWSFVILAITAVLQLVVVFFTGSVALLADTIHNIGDAVTAIPLWIAFRLARRPPSATFTYGYGRVEDLAGVTIVLIILFSAIVAGYQAIDRLLNPQPIEYLGWLAAAGVVGFIGNEAVAVFRIKVGREINSAALIADGYHARTDGFTSLAVVFGAGGVWLGFPLADPIIGLLITLAIFGIVWQSSKAIFTRMLDGVDPALTSEIRHAAEHVPGVRQVVDVRARWLGHRLTAELDIALDATVSVAAADAMTQQVEGELLKHMPALAAARIRVRSYDAATQAKPPSGTEHRVGHHDAPEPVAIDCALAKGVIEIVDTLAGERLTFTASRADMALNVSVEIAREPGRVETLMLRATADDPTRYISDAAPAEPHEFKANIIFHMNDKVETVPFSVVEPEGHHAH